MEIKNEVAINTINFINAELYSIADSLTITEKDLQDFQVTHQIMNVDSQAEQVFSYVRELETEKADLLIKLKD